MIKNWQWSVIIFLHFRFFTNFQRYTKTDKKCGVIIFTWRPRFPPNPSITRRVTMKKLRQIHFCCISVDDDVPNNDNCRRLLFRKAFYDKKSVLSYIDSVRSNLTPPSRNTVEVFLLSLNLESFQGCITRSCQLMTQQKKRTCKGRINYWALDHSFSQVAENMVIRFQINFSSMSNERLSHSFTPLVPSAKEEMEQTSPFPLKDAEDTLSLIQKNPTPNSRAISGTLARTRLQNNETVQSTNCLVIIQKKRQLVLYT